MFYIVETEEQLDRLQKIGEDEGVFIIPISSNDNFHPKLSTTVGLYIRPLDTEHGFIIPVDHPEGFNIGKNRVYQLLKNIPTTYTLDKKELLYHWNIQHSVDVSLLYSMIKYERLEYSKELPTINQFYNKFREFDNINQLLPISKLYESCEKVFDKVKHITKFKIPQGFDFYNKISTNVFYLLEQPGIRVYYDNFVRLFTPKDPKYNIEDNKVLTQYNLYNATSRPTNAFNSVNFAAIPKDLEHRNCFLPQGDYFVEFDFDGYHLRLLCDQIDYLLTEESAHKQLAVHYFGTEDITEEQYLEAKQINFQAIYGKIPPEHRHLEIFQKIQKYIDDMWSTFEEEGVVYNPISGKPFTKDLKDMHPSKLMNYMMQSLETSRNILILKEVMRYLQDKKTKVVLYTYDALLFDFHKEDGKQTLLKIQEILEENKKYPIKFKYSENFVL